MKKNNSKTKRFITGFLVSKDKKMPIKLEVRQPDKKEKTKHLSKAQKKRIQEMVGSGPNIEAILLNTEKHILESGEFPGLAEDIKMRRRHESQKRLFRREAAFISR